MFQFVDGNGRFTSQLPLILTEKITVILNRYHQSIGTTVYFTPLHIYTISTEPFQQSANATCGKNETDSLHMPHYYLQTIWHTFQFDHQSCQVSEFRNIQNCSLSFSHCKEFDQLAGLGNLPLAQHACVTCKVVSRNLGLPQATD